MNAEERDRAYGRYLRVGCEAGGGRRYPRGVATYQEVIRTARLLIALVFLIGMGPRRVDKNGVAYVRRGMVWLAMKRDLDKALAESNRALGVPRHKSQTEVGKQLSTL